MVFRWRTCLSGQEQELEGMLKHSGHPGHRYRAIQDAFLEMRQLSAQLADPPLPTASIAMVHDYNVMWAYQSAEIGREIDYRQNFCDLHRVLYQRGLLVDVVPPHADLNAYRMVILPSLMIIDEDFAGRIRDYVAAGGVVLAQGQIGMRDANNNYLPFRGPQGLQDVLGVLINGGMYLYSCVAPDESWGQRNYFQVGLAGQLGQSPVSGAASVWLGDLENNGSQVLLAISEDTYRGQPVVVEKATGSGLALYCAAAKVDPSLLNALFDYALAKAGIPYREDLPEHVEVIRRGVLTFVINHLDQPVSIPLDISGKVLRGKVQDGMASLQSYDVVIFFS